MKASMRILMLSKIHKILKLEDVIELEIQKLMYKHAQDTLPLPLMNLFPSSIMKTPER